MYNAQLNEVVFPHIITGNVLNNNIHNINHVNGGMVKIEDLNLSRNKFFGGNVEVLGLIKEYGFYACPHYEMTQNILGFYIHDPSMLTELGKRLIKEKYPNATVIFEKVTDCPHREMTAEEITKKKELIQKAVETGAVEAEIQNVAMPELENLLKSMGSGKSNLKVTTENARPTADKDLPITISKGQNK
jgi:hypothetical protein